MPDGTIREAPAPVARSMSPDKRGVQLGRRMLALYREIDPAIERVAVESGISCRKGCAACCSQLVMITLPEGVAMVEGLVRDPAKVVALTKRCYEMLAFVRLPPAEYFLRNVPCPFLLDDSSCAVYERRPSPCRLLLVKSDPSLCGPENLDQNVVKLDARKAEAVVANEAVRVLAQHGFPVLVAPMPVVLLWALKILAEGEDAVKGWLGSKEDLGVLDFRYWTSRLLQGPQPTPPARPPSEAPPAV